MNETWILVADAGRARVFSERPEAREWTEVDSFVNPDARRPGSDFTRDRPPRTIESMGTTRHAIEPHTTPQEKIEARFARVLDAALERGRQEHLYDRLVLVAPPHFLGTLSAHLGEAVRDCVVASIGKDLSKLPARRIRAHLDPFLEARTTAR